YQRPTTCIAFGCLCVLDEHDLQSGKIKRMNYSTETLIFWKERPTYNFHQSLNQHANSRPHNHI
ncbi:hypothetical protein, partial [Klebsiella michiganensis]|uniref:hypothetical protein n=1 Tax=Klebsiella michiganensis TaxID=1134687 RepID=UPI001D0E63BA